jgi:hypothetical protein
MNLQPSQITSYLIPILTFVLGTGLTGVLRIKDIIKQKKIDKQKEQDDKTQKEIENVKEKMQENEEKQKLSDLYNQLDNDFEVFKQDTSNKFKDVTSQIQSIKQQQEIGNQDNAEIKGMVKAILLKATNDDGTNSNIDEKK